MTGGLILISKMVILHDDYTEKSFCKGTHIARNCTYGGLRWRNRYLYWEAPMTFLRSHSKKVLQKGEHCVHRPKISLSEVPEKN